MMSETERYPDHVPESDRPDPTCDNVPEDVLSTALDWATMYVACPECGEQQFIPTLAGHNTTCDCRECGFEMKIVG